MRARLALIPNKEREKISYFFRHAIFWDTYGYVLLGDKPCAITLYKQVSWDPRSWLEYLTPHNLKMKKGWETWRKYESLFPHPNFVFLEEDFTLTSSHFIILIHRDALLEKIRIHQDDFQAVLGDKNGEHILTKSMSMPFLTQGLKNHDGLIGTVLGYGRNNAWAFYNQSNQMGLFTDDQEQLRMKTYCMQQGTWKFFTGSICRDFDHLPLPGFAAELNDPETLHLRKLYSKCRDNIADCYRKGDFLGITLRLLCQSPKNDIH